MGDQHFAYSIRLKLFSFVLFFFFLTVTSNHTAKPKCQRQFYGSIYRNVSAP